MREITQKEKDALEALIDATSLQSVLIALSELCDEKANHVTESWQDHALASEWSLSADVIGGAIGALSQETNNF